MLLPRSNTACAVLGGRTQLWNQILQIPLKNTFDRHRKFGRSISHTVKRILLPRTLRYQDRNWRSPSTPNFAAKALPSITVPAFGNSKCQAL